MKRSLLILSVLLYLGACSGHRTCPTYQNKDSKYIKPNTAKV